MNSTHLPIPPQSSRKWKKSSNSNNSNNNSNISNSISNKKEVSTTTAKMVDTFENAIESLSKETVPKRDINAPMCMNKLIAINPIYHDIFEIDGAGLLKYTSIKKRNNNNNNNNNSSTGLTGTTDDNANNNNDSNHHQVYEAHFFPSTHAYGAEVEPIGPPVFNRDYTTMAFNNGGDVLCLWGPSVIDFIILPSRNSEMELVRPRNLKKSEGKLQSSLHAVDHDEKHYFKIIDQFMPSSTFININNNNHHHHHSPLQQNQNQNQQQDDLMKQIFGGDNFDDIFIKCEWHPSIEGKHHLIAMTSKGKCAMIHITKRLEAIVEQKLLLTLPRADDDGGGGESIIASSSSSDNKRNRIVSFAYGASHGWQQFTLFIMCKDANVFILSPIIPSGYRLYTRDIIEMEMENDNILKGVKAYIHENGGLETLPYEIRRKKRYEMMQLEKIRLFLSETFGNFNRQHVMMGAGGNHMNMNRGKLIAASNITYQEFQPKLQGPLHIYQRPNHENSITNNMDGSSLSCITSSKAMARGDMKYVTEIPVLACAYKEKFLELIIITSKITPRFLFVEDDIDFNNFHPFNSEDNSSESNGVNNSNNIYDDSTYDGATIELFDLGFVGKTIPYFWIDFFKENTFYFVHPSMIVGFHITWMKDINNYILKEDVNDFSLSIDSLRKKTSKTRSLLACTNEEIIGTDILQTGALGNIMIARFSDGKFIKLNLTAHAKLITTKFDDDDDDNDDEKNVFDDNAFDKIGIKQLSKVIEPLKDEINSVLSDMPQTGGLSSMTLGNIDPKTTKLVQSYAKSCHEIGNNVKLIEKATLERESLLKTLSEHQQFQVDKMAEEINVVQEDMDGQKDRLQACREKGDDLSARMAVLLNTVKKIQPHFTSSELEYFENLKIWNSNTNRIDRMVSELNAKSKCFYGTVHNNGTPMLKNSPFKSPNPQSPAGKLVMRNQSSPVHNFVSPKPKQNLILTDEHTNVVTQILRQQQGFLEECMKKQDGMEKIFKKYPTR